jgi:AcrR family transcriptional regulator
MARITKDPEVRRNEFMDIAERLFVEKGYDHTSPSDIIRNAGVAQGTFYYYFRSKDEIVESIIERYLDRYEKYVYQVAGDESIDTARKLLLILEGLYDLSRKKMKIRKPAYGQAAPSNLRGYGEHLRTKIIPVIRQIVREGVDDGLFTTEFPDETADMLVVLISHVRDELKKIQDADAGHRKVEAARVMMEKLLGAPSGTFRSQP